MTQYTKRVIIYVPDGMQALGNRFGGQLGENHDSDGCMFGAPAWMDPSGALYCVQAAQVRDTFIANATGAVKAARLGKKMAIDNSAVPTPGTIVVHVLGAGDQPRKHIEAHGLTVIHDEEEDV